jgi:L-cysteine/cystine lyase
VDAAQSVGSLPLNLSDLQADFYAFTGHKWLCGPAGVGGLYIHPQAFKTLKPTFIGWRSIDVDEAGNIIGLKNDGQRFEVATSAFPQYEGLRAAIAVHHEWGTAQERYQQICQASQYLWEGLSKLAQVKCLKSSPPEAGLVSFQVDTSMSQEQLVQALEKQGFYLRTLSHPNCIRACVHYFTLAAEIDELIKGIEYQMNR